MSAGFVGGVIGATIGFFLGNPALGWAIGSGLASALNGTPNRKGPRLSDLQPQSSEYGRPIAILFGDQGVAGNIMWAAPLKEASHEEGGKGGGGGVTVYTYSADFAVLICEGIHEVSGIFAGPDKRVIYDGINAPSGWTVTLYPGDESQLPDPLMESYLGVGNVPAYRGYCYAVFNNYPLEKDGNRIPFLTFEFQDRLGGQGLPGGAAPGACGVPYIPPYIIAQPYIQPFSPVLRPHVVYNSGADEFWIPAITAAGFDWAIFNGDGSLKEYAGGVDLPSPYVPEQTSGALYNQGSGYIYASDGVFIYVWSNAIELQRITLPGITAAPSEPMGMATQGTRVWVQGTNGTTEHLFSFHATTYAVTDELSSAGRYFECLTPTPDGKCWYISRSKTTPTDCYLAYTTPGSHVETAFASTNLGERLGRITFDPARNCMWMWYTSGIKQYLTASDTFGAVAMAIPLNPVDPYMLDYDTSRNLLWCRVPDGTTVYGGHLWAFCPADGSVMVDYAIPSTATLGNRNHLIFQNGRIVADGHDQPTDQYQLAMFNYSYGFQTTPVANPASNPPVYLDEVLTTLHLMSGLTTDTLDVSDPLLHVRVEGYQLARQLTIRDAIETLRPAFYFDGIESEGKVKFVSRGSTSYAAVIPDEDLMAHSADEANSDGLDDLITQRQMEVELPRAITVTYLSGAKKWDTMSRMSRRLVGWSGDETTMEFPLSLNEEQAQGIADANLHLAWVQRLTYSFTLTNKYANLEPTDLVQVHGYGMRIVKITEQPNGLRQFDAVRETSTPYNPVVHTTEPIDARVIVRSPGSTLITRLEIM
jgi:hypothetical protein